MVHVAAQPQTLHHAVPSSAASAVDRLVQCEIGGERFVLPLEQVAEVVALGMIPAPAPRGWIGTLVRGGRPVPIGGLGFLLDLPAAPTERHDMRAILLRGAGNRVTFGVTVDGVPTVIDAAGVALQPQPLLAQRAATGLVRGSVVLGETLLLVLDADAIRERLTVGLVCGDDDRVIELRALPCRRRLPRPCCVPGRRVMTD